MKLEVGKRYRTRDGRETSPLENGNNHAYPFKAKVGGHIAYWTEQGFWYLAGVPNRLDLVEEIEAMRKTYRDYLNAQQKIFEAERVFDWRGWVEKIPAIKFNPDWEVQVVPPFGGALARFWVHYKGEWCSVYLDGFDLLGHCGEPYWEVYPYEDDVYRCTMNNTDSLIEAISKSLNYKQ